MAWVDADTAGAAVTSRPATIAITAAVAALVAVPARTVGRMPIKSSLTVARSSGSGLTTGFTHLPTRSLPPPSVITRMES
ncbi:hypothetical protein [Amycolatopsis sp. lyj-90]|uniref:hypothetical protein n=1 Tax=Amycolatopsis sp. lyj-90 TaxID=2789285 RepID=UPI00397E67F7